MIAALRKIFARPLPPSSAHDAPAASVSRIVASRTVRSVIVWAATRSSPSVELAMRSVIALEAARIGKMASELGVYVLGGDHPPVVGLSRL